MSNSQEDELHTVLVEVSTREKQRIERAAELQGCTVSNFMAQAAYALAKTVIKQQRITSLSGNDKSHHSFSD